MGLWLFVDKGLVLTRVGLWFLVVLFETLNCISKSKVSD